MIAASVVKELRQISGAGMMDCKKALQEADGDTEKAMVILRKNGIAKAEKKAGFFGKFTKQVQRTLVVLLVLKY